MVGFIAHDLKPLSVLFQVIEDKFFALAPNIGDSGSNTNWFLKPLRGLGDGRILLDEIADVYLNMELVGVGISFGIFFEISYHL